MESHSEKDVVCHVQPLSFLSYKVLVRSGYEPLLLRSDFVEDMAHLFAKEERLCSKIFWWISNSGVSSIVYGGYVRDLIARKVYKKMYITKHRNINVWKKIHGQDINYPDVFQLRDIDVHVEKAEDVEMLVFCLISNAIDTRNYSFIKEISGYSPSTDAVRLYFYHTKYPFIHIKVDISCIPEFLNSFDFDVNTLGLCVSQYRGPIPMNVSNSCSVNNGRNHFGDHNFAKRILHNSPNIQILSTNCDPIGIIINIMYGKFTVLTSNGKPDIKHNSPDDCIDSRSARGKKLLERINKMRKRGWVPQNERCSNENCILHLL